MKKIVILIYIILLFSLNVFSQSDCPDLSSYPNMFIKNGLFDGFIVVGDKADADDVVVASDIIASFQNLVRGRARTLAG